MIYSPAHGDTAFTVLRIELLEVAPLVWRRVLVSEHWKLANLHQYLQWVMGWTDSHAHEFQVGDGLIAPDWWIQEAESEEIADRYRDERLVSVAAVVAELGGRGEFEYRYDMGDGWERPAGLRCGRECVPSGGRGRPADMQNSWRSSVIVSMRSTRPRRAGSAVCATRKASI